MKGRAWIEDFEGMPIQYDSEHLFGRDYLHDWKLQWMLN